MRRLAEVGAGVETLLNALLAPAPQLGEIARPARLLEAMRYSVLGGGKRLRPFLVVATSSALGGQDHQAYRVGAAIELLHSYSLVHDDLPAMDNDDLRRGRPTLHRAYDDATAILTGDALLTLAFEVLADEATAVDGATRARLCAGLARAAGLGGMVGGQMLDLAAEQAGAPPSVAAVRQLQAMKTGALLKFSVEAGATLGGATGPIFAALSRYGQALGAAFQIADDLLDAEGDEQALGKRAGKDAARGKATLVAAIGASAARAELARLVDEAQAAIDAARLAEKGESLRAAARFVAQRRH